MADQNVVLGRNLIKADDVPETPSASLSAVRAYRGYYIENLLNGDISLTRSEAAS